LPFNTPTATLRIGNDILAPNDGGKVTALVIWDPPNDGGKVTALVIWDTPNDGGKVTALVLWDLPAAFDTTDYENTVGSS